MYILLSSWLIEQSSSRMAAVRLPKEYRFEGEDMAMVRREENRVILEPAYEWPQSFLEILGAWGEEIERPPQPPITAQRDVFE